MGGGGWGCFWGSRGGVAGGWGGGGGFVLVGGRWWGPLVGDHLVFTIIEAFLPLQSGDSSQRFMKVSFELFKVGGTPFIILG